MCLARSRFLSFSPLFFNPFPLNRRLIVHLPSSAISNMMYPRTVCFLREPCVRRVLPFLNFLRRVEFRLLFPLPLSLSLCTRLIFSSSGSVMRHPSCRPTAHTMLETCYLPLSLFSCFVDASSSSPRSISLPSPSLTSLLRPRPSDHHGTEEGRRFGGGLDSEDVFFSDRRHPRRPKFTSLH